MRTQIALGENHAGFGQRAAFVVSGAQRLAVIQAFANVRMAFVVGT